MEKIIRRNLTEEEDDKLTELWNKIPDNLVDTVDEIINFAIKMQK